MRFALFGPPDHKTLVKRVLLELPDDIAHISYNKTHVKYVLFVLSPVLIAGFRWVHRAHFLVRQGGKGHRKHTPDGKTLVTTRMF